MAPSKAAPIARSGSGSSSIDGNSQQPGATVAQRLASLTTGHHHHHHHHLLQPDDKWVPVSWMPHTTLSQTSHVVVEIRSALVVVSAGVNSIVNSSFERRQVSKEWRVEATIQGMAGLAMVSSLLPCQTPAAAVVDASSSSSVSSAAASHQQLAILGANRVCQWDRVVHLPMRWRDLPRDAYLQLQVLSEKTNQVVRPMRATTLEKSGT
jgi:hypothetical protein